MRKVIVWIVVIAMILALVVPSVMVFMPQTSAPTVDSVTPPPPLEESVTTDTTGAGEDVVASGAEMPTADVTTTEP